MSYKTILLSIVLTFSSVSYAAYPDYIESDTIEDICKKISCHNQLDEYYRSYYYPRKFHKALAISHYKSGNRYVNDYFGIGYSNSSESSFIAKKAALNNCKQHGKNCEILLVNNRFENKDLYQKLIRSITPASNVSSSNNSSNSSSSKPQIPFNAHAVGNSWVCGIDYYKSGKACRRVPTNASSTYTSNFFYCNSGFNKSGDSCIKNKTNSNSNSNNNKSITKTTTSKSSSIQAMFFNENGPTILFWIALVLFIYFISPKSSSNKKPRKVVITKDTPKIYPQTSPKPKPVVTTKSLEVIKKSPQTLLGEKRVINKQLKNGLITKRTADSRIKKAIEAEEMRLIIENINNKPNIKKVKSSTKPRINPISTSLKQEKVVIPKPKPNIEPINEDDLLSSETLDFMGELGLPVAELMYQDAVSFLSDDDGSPADLEKAFSFALKSADMGYDEAKFLVGTMYLVGDGTPKNINTGIGWLNKAAKSSNTKVSSRAKHMLEQI